MSAKATSHVFQYSPSKGSPRLVLLAIADEARDDGRARCDDTTLIHKTQLSRAQIYKITAALQLRGLVRIWITDERNRPVPTHGRNRKRTYQLLGIGLEGELRADLPAPRPQVETSQHETSSERAVQRVETSQHETLSARGNVSDEVSRKVSRKVSEKVSSDTSPTPPIETFKASKAFPPTPRGSLVDVPRYPRGLVRDAECPSCNAEPGERCRLVDGRAEREQNHLERVFAYHAQTDDADAERALVGAANLGRTRASVDDGEEVRVELERAYPGRPDCVSAGITAWNQARATASEASA